MIIMAVPQQISYIALAVSLIAIAGAAAVFVDLISLENKLVDLEDDVDDIPLPTTPYDDSNLKEEITELKSIIPNTEWQNFIDDLAKENRDNLDDETDNIKAQINTLTNKINSLEAKLNTVNTSSSSSSTNNRVTETDMDLKTLGS
jgi:cell division septation protein DedD